MAASHMGGERASTSRWLISATILLGLFKAFEQAQFQQLLNAAERRGFPLRALRLACQHSIIRELVMWAVPQVTPFAQVKPCCQGVLAPPFSSSVSFLRLVITLWQGTRGSPACGGGRFSVTVHTGPLEVATKLVNATTSLGHELEKARLRVAPTKSKAASRSTPVRAELQRRLREPGVMWSKHERSLSVDSAAGAICVSLWQTNVAQRLGNALIDSTGWLAQELADGAPPCEDCHDRPAKLHAV